MRKHCQYYERVFNHFDQNGDGKISASELRCCIESTGWMELPLEEAEVAIEILDSDGDGLLGLEDFFKLVEGNSSSTSSGEDIINEEEKVNGLREAFKMYVENNNERNVSEYVITPKSLMRMLSRLGQKRTTIDECKVMIAQFDLNGDGVLNFDEFRIMMMMP